MLRYVVCARLCRGPGPSGIEAVSDSDATVDIELRGRFEVTPKAGIEPDIAVVLLVEQVVDADERRDLLAAGFMNIAQPEIDLPPVQRPGVLGLRRIHRVKTGGETGGCIEVVAKLGVQQ